MNRNIFLLSPSKTLTALKNSNCDTFTIPVFIEKSQKIVNQIKLLSHNNLEELYDASSKIAFLNWQRYQEWKLPFNLANSRQAILYFNGDVYEGLSVVDFDFEDFAYAQNNLRIISGLYGLLRPLDLIQPYRLEMGTSFRVDNQKTLYNFWSNDITTFISEELGNNGRIVNLSSNEYYKVIDRKLEKKVIHFEFRENKPEGLKVVPILSKRARGLMARFAVKNKIINVDDLKLFDYENYIFYEPLSTENKWVFIRRS